MSIVLPKSLCLHDTIINIRAKINCVRHQTAGEINMKFICNSYRVSPSDRHVKNRHISASEPLEKLYDEANESYLAAVFAHIND